MELKVGLCGFGTMAKGHAQMLQLHEGVKLVAIADTVPENRAKAEELYHVKTFETGEELIANGGLDVVFVVVPTYLHTLLAVSALKSGCHVFCEKPMSLNPDLCTQMIDAANESGKYLMIGQVLRFWPEYVFLKEAIDSGRYGKLEALSMTRVGGTSMGWQKWYLDERRGGSQLFDRHLHDCDAVTWLLGTPKSVYTYGIHKDCFTQGGVSHSFTEYYYDNNLVVSAEGSADAIKGFPFTAAYRAFFEKAVIEYNSRSTPTLQVFEGGEPIVPEIKSKVPSLTSGMNITNSAPYYNEEVYFFDCIRRGVKPETITPEKARESVRVVSAEMLSAKTHSRINL